MKSNKNDAPRNELDIDIEDSLASLRDRLRVRCEAYTDAANEVERKKTELREAEERLEEEAAKLRPLHDQLNKIAVANGHAAAKPKAVAAKKVEKKPAKTLKQTWLQFCSTIKAISNGKINLAQQERHPHWDLFNDLYRAGKRPIEAMDEWRAKEGISEYSDEPIEPPPPASKDKKPAKRGLASFNQLKLAAGGDEVSQEESEALKGEKGEKVGVAS